MHSQMTRDRVHVKSVSHKWTQKWSTCLTISVVVSVGVDRQVDCLAGGALGPFNEHSSVAVRLLLCSHSHEIPQRLRRVCGLKVTIAAVLSNTPRLSASS